MLNINDNTLRQFDAFNSWLGDVYGKGTSFSTLLINTGFCEAEIEYIKREHLSEFLQAIMNLMASYTDLPNDQRNMLMLLHYGLIDGKPQTLEALGARAGVCRERIRQLVNKRLELYRHPERRAKFQNDFATIGRRLLNDENRSQDYATHG
jgi:DNA-directed RNA polymerase sigma subunit (sigma70/sigma32)